MAITYTDNGGGAPNGSDLEFTYTFPVIQTEDVKVALNGVTQATTKYAVDNVSNPTKITFNNTSVDSSVQESSGAPKSGVRVRVYRETTVGKANGDEDPKAVFAAGSSIRAIDLNANQEQSLMAIHELQTRPIETEDIQGDAIVGSLIADDQINSEHYVAGSIDHEHLANDIIDGDNIQDDVINSEHYVDGSIDNQHLANSSISSAKIVDGTLDTATLADNAVTEPKIINSAVTTAKIANSAVTANKIADGTVGTLELANSSVTTAKIADTNVTTAKLADDAVTSAKIADTSVANNHLQPQCVTNDKIATATIVSGNIANGNILTDKIADDAVTTAKIATNAVTNVEIASSTILSGNIANGNINTAKIQDDAVTIDKIADAAIVTNSEQASHSVDDNTFFTTAAAEARYFNASTGETIKDGQSFPDNDTTIATTAAINDRIIDLVDDVGGFVPIANETSFPNANPDVNNGTGTIVSVSTLASNHTSNGSGVITISNGTVGNSTVTINGAGNNITYSAGYGLLVETTTTLNTYTFHRLVPKATEVTTVAGKATEIGRLGTADAVADMAILGTADVVSDLNTLGTADVVADMNMLAVSDVISDMNTLAVTSVINDMDTVATNVSNVNTTAGSISNVNTTAGSISNVNTVAGSIANVNTVGSAISNVNTTAGSISNVNSVASNMANVNNFADRYQISSNNPSTDGGGNALAAGDLYFNTSANELKVYNGSSWQAGVTATGNFALTTGNTFTGDNRYNDGVKALFGTGSDLEILHDGTNSRLNSASHNLNVRTPRFGVFNGGGTETILLATADGSVDLYYDNSKKFETTSAGATVTGALSVTGAIGMAANQYMYGSSGIDFYGDGSDAGSKLVQLVDGGFKIKDSNKIQFGNSQDLQIYHDSSTNDSFIKESGSGAFKICSNLFRVNNAANSEVMLSAAENGAVELYHNNSKKFETTSAGVSVTGGLTADGASEFTANVKFDGATAGRDVTFLRSSTTLRFQDNTTFSLGDNDDFKAFHDGSKTRFINTTGNLELQSDNYIFRDKDNGDLMMQLLHDGASELYYDGSKKFRTYSDGAIADANLWVGTDNKKLIAGGHADLEVYHSGSHSYVKNTTNYPLWIQNIDSQVINISNTSGGNKSAVFAIGAQAELYYGGSKKFETTSTGAAVTGRFGIDKNPDTKVEAKLSVFTATGNDDASDWGADGIFQLTHQGTQAAGSEVLLIGAASGAVGQIASGFGFGRESTGNWGTYISFKTHSTSTSNIDELIERWRINSTGHFLPKTDSTVDIGTNTVRVRNGYFDTLYGDGSNLTGINTDLVSDTSPQLGGNLDTNSHEILLDDDHAVKFGASSDLQIYHNPGTSASWISNTTGLLNIRSTGIAIRAFADSASYINASDNGAVDLYYDNSKKFATNSGGAEVFGHLVLGDNRYLKLGNSGGTADVQMFHNGSNFHIQHTNAGSLYMDSVGHHYFRNSAGNEFRVVAKNNAEVELYYDAVVKAETASHGMYYNEAYLHHHVNSGNSSEIRFTTNGVRRGSVYADNGNTVGFTNSSGGWNARWSSSTHTSHVNINPNSNNTYSLGTTSLRWANIFTNDLNLSNEGSANDVDGTWGDWTIQEGESDLFLKNNRSGKKYKFNLMEVS